MRKYKVLLLLLVLLIVQAGCTPSDEPTLDDVAVLLDDIENNYQDGYSMEISTSEEKFPDDISYTFYENGDYELDTMYIENDRHTVTSSINGAYTLCINDVCNEDLEEYQSEASSDSEQSQVTSIYNKYLTYAIDDIQKTIENYEPNKDVVDFEQEEDYTYFQYSLDDTGVLYTIGINDEMNTIYYNIILDKEIYQEESYHLI